jgi:UDP-glucose 4-epimerase
MTKGKILIVGGAGYIGAMVNKILTRAGFETIVLDLQASQSGNAINGDMGDRALLNKIFTQHTIDAVVHLAAFINVGESMAHPAKYYENNVCKTYTLLETMRSHQVKKIIFSSSAAIYGIPSSSLVDELQAQHPINPYGRTKLMVEQLLADFDHAYHFKFCSLRYFNAAGGDPEGEICNERVEENNLIPIALRCLIEKRSLPIFGCDYPTPDGTCVRDYVHIYDLGTAHLYALQKLLNGSESAQYNLGNGKGYSVREVIQSIEKVTGQKLQTHEMSRRPGDPPVLVANASKATKELGWQPQYPELVSIVTHAWNLLRKS